MGVYIKGMTMPENCSRCPMLEGNRDDGLCHAASRWLDDEEYWLWYQYPEGDIDTSKPSNCPLVRVPPHGDLIDRDKLRGIMFIGNQCIYSWDEIEDALDNAPTVIPAEEGK